MKELTKQWNWPITRKFEINYSDFQPNAGPKKNLPFVWIQKRTVITFAQIKNTILFSGSGITIAELFLTDQEGLSPPADLNRSFCSYDVSLPVTAKGGKYQAIPARQLDVAGSLLYQILNYDSAEQLYLVLRLGLGESIDNLTQGQALLWFTYIRMR